MNDRVKITYWQLFQVIALSNTVLVLTYLPVMTVPPQNVDLWICEIISFFIMLIISLPTYYLWKKNPTQSVIQICKTVLGKVGILIGLLYVFFFIHITAITTAQLGEFMTSAVMPETPISFFIIMIIAFSVYTVYKGLNVVGRMSEIVFPITILAIITIIILLAKNIKLENLLPIMEKGIVPVMEGGVGVAFQVIEIVGIAMILPNLKNGKDAVKVYLLSFSLITFVLLITTIPVLTIWGSKQASNLLFPFFTTIKIASVGGFIERIEAVHMAIWILGTFVKVSFFYYLSVIGISQVFNFKDYRMNILPVGAVIVPLSILIAPNIISLREFTSYKIFTWYVMFFILLLPCVLFISSIIKRKAGVTK